MTSPAKIRANWRNSLKSTGPRSRIGKLIASRNARRHGLTLPVLADPALSREADELARTIETSLAGAAVDELGHACACRIAETVVDARRVRQAKMRLITALDTDQGNGALIRQLSSLDKYEGRAFSNAETAMMSVAAVVAVVARIERSEMRGDMRDLPSRMSQAPSGRRDPAERPNWQNEPNAETAMISAPALTPAPPEVKGCVAPRDPVGSRLDPSPARQETSRELTPHGEVET